MPSSSEILQTLAEISNGRQELAVLWHVLLACLIAALALGWRPTRRLGATVLALPLLSVSALAWLHGNPFNGAVFLLGSVALAFMGFRLPVGRLERPSFWASAIGVVMVAFGWAYPHFLDGARWGDYLYRAPTGLIPCPTLSFVVGFALLANGFSSKSWARTLGFLGIFYALFGALRLAVIIDIVLLVGAVALLAVTGLTRPRPKREPGSERN